LHFIKYKPVNNLTHAGTGKKVIAAFDYRNFRKKHPGDFPGLSISITRQGIRIP